MWRITMMRKNKGFTLFETLLVLGIMSAFLVMSLRFVSQKATEARIDKASIQIQQILNAALVYYLNNSKWPADISELVLGQYLTSTMVNPWGGGYVFYSNNKLFYVWAGAPATSTAQIAEMQRIAGRLPQGYVTQSDPPLPPSACVIGNCKVVAAVSVPGQNLNNARGVNFANLYHPGACVPAPVCPANTSPQIMVIPVSVSGFNDKNSSTIYPISSFTAYAVPTTPQVYTGMPRCGGGANKDCDVVGSTTGNFWRVCLEVITEVGNVGTVGTPANDTYGADVTVLAITRCSPDTEPVGSDFSVYETP
jgi:competence protein ComGC